MLQKVRKTMEELHMVSGGETILAGVSGGADSVCLLLMLEKLQQVMGFKLESVHVEHGIRGQESREDAAFVEKLCREHGIPLHMIEVDVPGYSAQTGKGVEEAARELRYRAFASLNGKIALAHHMEDNAETILFQLVRGSGVKGLCGMQPIRVDEDGVVYIRPLLQLHRSEIEEYLEAEGQAYCTDSTNLELDYSRNFLRNVVLPQLAQVNAQSVEHINAAAGRLREVWEYLETETDRVWEELVHIEADGGLRIATEELLELHPAMQKELLLRAIATVGGRRKDVTAVHVEDVLELCRKQSGRKLALANDVCAVREFGDICLVKRESEETVASTVKEDVGESHDVKRGSDRVEVTADMLQELCMSGQPLVIPVGTKGECLRIRISPNERQGRNEVSAIEIAKKPYTKWLDYDKIKQGFCIRTRQTGDYLIGDAAGHRKKLKQYFIDEKIPVGRRETMWLLAQESLVFWAVGGRISEHVKVTADTKTIIELQYDGGK